MGFYPPCELFKIGVSHRFAYITTSIKYIKLGTKGLERAHCARAAERFVTLVVLPFIKKNRMRVYFTQSHIHAPKVKFRIRGHICTDNSSRVYIRGSYGEGKVCGSFY